MNAANPVGGSTREDRIAAYQSAAAILAGPGGSGTGASPVAIRVAELLPVAGDLLRRTSAVTSDLGVVDQALSALSPAEVSKYLESLDTEELVSQLRRAADESVEAGLAETDDEREMWAASALEALFARDRAESVKAAVARWLTLPGRISGGPASLPVTFEQKLAELDRLLASKARTLTALNARRRTERDLLDTQFQAAAWWFSGRSECDDLLRILSGEVKQPSPHVEQCPECQRDLARARPVETPPERHLTSDEAWRFELGELSAKEKRRVQQHAESCLECAQVFWAMDEGDKAIAELETGSEAVAAAARPFGLAASSPSAQGTGTRPPQRAHREVARREAYRVVAIRGPSQRMRVLVQPTAGRGLAMAVMSIPPQRNIFEARQTSEGLEFDLGDAKEVEGRTAKLTVRVTEQGDNETLDVDL